MSLTKAADKSIKYALENKSTNNALYVLREERELLSKDQFEQFQSQLQNTKIKENEGKKSPSSSSKRMYY